jgi:hypothetical protein
MGKVKDPAFLFYPQDFLVGTMIMSDEQVGKYIRLLCLQHAKGGKLTEKDILKITGSHDDEIMEKFVKYEDGYANKRLLEEMQKRVDYSQKRKENIMKRWNKKEDTSVIPPHINSDTSVIQLYNNGNTNVIPLENENEYVNEDIKSLDVKVKRKVFIPPTLNEVEAYCISRNNNVDAKQFYDYFTVMKWIDKQGDPVKNWKGKIITWEKSNRNTPQLTPQQLKDQTKNDIIERTLKKYAQ